MPPYISQRGSTRSSVVVLEASRIFQWAELHMSALFAMYISGRESWQGANSVIRRWIRVSALHAEMFNQIYLLWGNPNMDLLVLHLNRKV